MPQQIACRLLFRTLIAQTLLADLPDDLQQHTLDLGEHLLQLALQHLLAKQWPRCRRYQNYKHLHKFML